MLTGRNFIAGEWRDGADWIEDVSPSDVGDVVGGVRASSYGPREQGRAAIEFYTQTKTSYNYAGAPE